MEEEKTIELPTQAQIKLLHRRGYMCVIRKDGSVNYTKCVLRPRKPPRYTAAQLDDAIVRLEKFNVKKIVLMRELGMKTNTTLNSWVKKRKEHPELWGDPPVPAPPAVPAPVAPVVPAPLVPAPVVAAPVAALPLTEVEHAA